MRDLSERNVTSSSRESPNMAANRKSDMNKDSQTQKLHVLKTLTANFVVDGNNLSACKERRWAKHNISSIRHRFFDRTNYSSLLRLFFINIIHNSFSITCLCKVQTGVFAGKKQHTGKHMYCSF